MKPTKLWKSEPLDLWDIVIYGVDEEQTWESG